MAAERVLLGRWPRVRTSLRPMRVFAVGDLDFSTSRGTHRRAAGLLNGLQELGLEVVLAPTGKKTHPSADWAAKNEIEGAGAGWLSRPQSKQEWCVAFTQSASKLVAFHRIDPHRVLWDLHGLHLAEAIENRLAGKSLAAILRAEMRTRTLVRKSPLVITANARLATWYAVSKGRWEVIQGGYTRDALDKNPGLVRDHPTPRRRELTYVGNLSRYQGIHDLISALDLMAPSQRPTLNIFSFDPLPEALDRNWVAYHGGKDSSTWSSTALSGAAMVVPRNRNSAASFGYPSKVYDYALLGIPIMLGPKVPKGPRELESCCFRLPRLEPSAILEGLKTSLRGPISPSEAVSSKLRPLLWSTQLQRALERL